MREFNIHGVGRCGGRYTLQFSQPVRILAEFPTNPDLRLGAIGYVERFFEYCVLNGEAF